MLYISKNNIVTGDRLFTAGHKYTFEEIEGCDLSNFTVLSESEAAALEKKSKKVKAAHTAPAGGIKTPEGAEEVI